MHASVVSHWEVAIKARAGKLEVGDDLMAHIDAAGLAWLHLRPEHVWGTRDLELGHRDPFDRMLLAQARHERVPLLTADRILLGADLEVVTVDARR